MARVADKAGQESGLRAHVCVLCCAGGCFVHTCAGLVSQVRRSVLASVHSFVSQMQDLVPGQSTVCWLLVGDIRSVSGSTGGAGHVSRRSRAPAGLPGGEGSAAGPGGAALRACLLFTEESNILQKKINVPCNCTSFLVKLKI